MLLTDLVEIVFLNHAHFVVVKTKSYTWCKYSESEYSAFEREVTYPCDCCSVLYFSNARKCFANSVCCTVFHGSNLHCVMCVVCLHHFLLYIGKFVNVDHGKSVREKDL